MTFWESLHHAWSGNHPDVMDDAIRQFTGRNHRYFLFKWKFARGFSQWNWAAFFFGPVWLALRRNYVWSVVTALALVAGDLYFTTNPYHVTVTLEVMLFCGAMANRIYYKKFSRIRTALIKSKWPNEERSRRLANAGGRDWSWGIGIGVLLVALTVVLPSLAGVHLFRTTVRRVEVQSLLWTVFSQSGDPATQELSGLRQDYQMARLRGQFERSLSVNENALRLACMKLGSENPYAIAMQSDLIENKLNLGAFKDVLPLTEATIKQYQLQFGKDHMFIAFMMNNLVSNYLYQGRIDDAKSTCFNALLILERYSKNETHPVILSNLAAVYSNMAVVQQQFCQYDDAEKNAKDALQLGVQAFKGYSLYTCMYLERLGDLYIEQLKLDEAEELFEQAKGIVAKQLGPGNPMTAAIFLKQGEIRLLRNQLDPAEKCVAQAHALNEQYYGALHQATAESAYMLSRVEMTAGKLSAAEKYGRQALDITGQSIGQENVIYGKYLVHMAEVLMIKNNNTEAERMLKDALVQYSRIYGEYHQRVLEPLEPLLALYEKTNNRVDQWGVSNRVRRIKNGEDETIPDTSKRLTI